MDFNGSTLRKCGAGAGTFCPEPEPELSVRTFYLEPESESEPKCFPRAGAGAGAVKNFHGSASLVLGYNIHTPYSPRWVHISKEKNWLATNKFATSG